MHVTVNIDEKQLFDEEMVATLQSEIRNILYDDDKVKKMIAPLVVEAFNDLIRGDSRAQIKFRDLVRATIREYIREDENFLNVCTEYLKEEAKDSVEEQSSRYIKELDREVKKSLNKYLNEAVQNKVKSILAETEETE